MHISNKIGDHLGARRKKRKEKARYGEQLETGIIS
jgi:hypothetical protein